MLRGTDGILREAPSAAIAATIYEPEFYESDDALRGYFDTPRPANDNVRTYRSVRSTKARHCYNSTSFKYVDVALPRVSILDGQHVDGVAA